MRNRPEGVAVALAATWLAAAACSVTWQEPQVQPLNPTRQYAAPVAVVCDAIAAALAAIDLTIEKPATAHAAAPPGAAEAGACLLPTEPHRLPERGADINYLRKVAYVGAGDSFSHGRLAVTANARQTTGELTRVRLATRIEGFDAGYRLLRSNGLVEEALFRFMQDELGLVPVE